MIGNFGFTELTHAPSHPIGCSNSIDLLVCNLCRVGETYKVLVFSRPTMKSSIFSGALPPMAYFLLEDNSANEFSSPNTSSIKVRTRWTFSSQSEQHDPVSVSSSRATIKRSPDILGRCIPSRHVSRKARTCSGSLVR